MVLSLALLLPQSQFLIELPTLDSVPSVDCSSLTSVKVSGNTTIHPNAFDGCVALYALADRYSMDIDTYLIQVPILRSTFYHFMLCERVGSFLKNKDDIMKVIDGFLFIYPEAAPFTGDYVLPDCCACGWKAWRRIGTSEARRRSERIIVIIAIVILIVIIIVIVIVIVIVFKFISHRLKSWRSGSRSPASQPPSDWVGERRQVLI
jgi:hypothetical protein